MPMKTLLLSLAAAATLALTGCDCGDDDDDATGDGDADADGDGDGDGDADADGDGDGDGDGDADCGDDPCASHQGEQSFVEEGAPADAADTFDGGAAHPAGTDADREPHILYPSHETMFPLNISRIRHEWRAGAGATLYELSFVGPNTTVRVFTRTTDWLPTDEEWDWIAESNRGEAVVWTVRGLDEAAPGEVWVSQSVTLYFSRAAVLGAIYYWSTGSQGIMKGLPASAIPSKFFTDPAAADAETCTACHSLSRDGTRLAVGYGGEKLWEVSVPERERILPVGDERERESSWTTFSPDGSMLLVARDGDLTLLDADTGAPIGDGDGVVPLPPGSIATHPDWSALGDQVAITLGTRGGNKEVEGGSIALLPWDGAAWGDPEVIVEAGGGEDNNFFPVFSPDSQWIAYVNATGKSKDALTATLRLVPAAGGEPTTLVRINERVNDLDGVTGIGNSMPTWAPSTRPGIFWLAFSSLRAYASLRPQDDKEDQIWIAAIDPAGAPDPSYAAFWAPFQSIEEGNHRAFWTHSAEDTPCTCAEFCGDRLDNDCDGQADEADCVQCAAAEVCGNGIDDDCDCQVDDCIEEICDDGIDNDFDGRIDGDDGDCLF